MEADTEPSSRPLRLVLVGCCLLAVVLAGTVLPAPGGGGDGLSATPVEAALSEEAAGDLPSTDGVDSAGPRPDRSAAGAAGSGGFGALTPGEETAVGGDVSGALRSQDAEVHLTVRSEQRAYWRTGAYGNYTGGGWRQRGTASPYERGVPVDGANGSRVDYEVTLNRSATALPTVWRPVSVDGVDGVEVTDRRALRPAGAVPPGTAFAGTSVRPPRDPERLRATGRDYPAAVQRRYADPGDASGRLTELTEEVTADADGPYETARQVEAWLEANKEYSLNASRTGEDVADTFVFEMDRGYCEYYATAMTVMLRSQGIPARYVVGYSTGEQVGPDTYRVRALNAHAWVEVYFEGVGWVQFDPTPGADRLERERASVRAQEGTDYAPREEGSPDEEFGPPADDDREPETTGAGLEVALNRTPVPGTPVAATVTEGGEPVVNRTVLFNGAPVGETDGNGTVVGTVPYADRLRVRVATGDQLAAAGRLFAAGGPFADGHDGATYPVETDATVTVTGPRRPGATVTVTAAVDDQPVPDARVLVDGDPVATTDEAGRAAVELPAESGEVTVTVEREPVAGETTVRVPELELSVEPAAPLALPGTGATATVTLGEEPVSGAAVTVDGRTVGTTGPDGRVSFALPLAAGATVGTEVASLRAEHTVGGLARNLLALSAVTAGLLAAPVVLARRWGLSARDLVAGLARAPGRLFGVARGVLVALATRGLAGVSGRLRAVLGAVAAALRGRGGPADLRRAARGGTAGDGVGSGDADPEGRAAVRAAWRRLVERVSVSRPETLTPGELARHAVERDGLPADPVWTLRDAFREVEYGARPAADRVDRVRRALRRLDDEEDR